MLVRLAGIALAKHVDSDHRAPSLFFVAAVTGVFWTSLGAGTAGEHRMLGRRGGLATALPAIAIGTAMGLAGALGVAVGTLP